MNGDFMNYSGIVALFTFVGFLGFNSALKAMDHPIAPEERIKQYLLEESDRTKPPKIINPKWDADTKKTVIEKLARIEKAKQQIKKLRKSQDFPERDELIDASPKLLKKFEASRLAWGKKIAEQYEILNLERAWILCQIDGNCSVGTDDPDAYYMEQYFDPIRDPCKAEVTVLISATAGLGRPYFFAAAEYVRLLPLMPGELYTSRSAHFNIVWQDCSFKETNTVPAEVPQGIPFLIKTVSDGTEDEKPNILYFKDTSFVTNKIRLATSAAPGKRTVFRMSVEGDNLVAFQAPLEPGYLSTSECPQCALGVGIYDHLTKTGLRGFVWVNSGKEIV